jgi:threonine/homoserine/homoserine lactone efflux protein
MIAIVAIGLASLIETMSWWFDWLRIAGAVYLIWLGVKLIRSSGVSGDLGRVPAPRGGFFLQGLLVLMSNPKALGEFAARWVANVKSTPLASRTRVRDTPR